MIAGTRQERPRRTKRRTAVQSLGASRDGERSDPVAAHCFLPPRYPTFIVRDG
jgi:hypothetical protein